MSDAVSALKNASDNAGIATVSEIGPIGMITLRGDLMSKPLIKAASSAAGNVELPAIGACAFDGMQGMAWMSPDEVLILCPYAAVTPRLVALQDALSGQHALAVNVSDARAVFEVRGPHTREVIAKLAPVNMAPDSFGSGDFRRTRLAQVPAALWMPDATSARLICFRSVAHYVFDLLRRAAQPGSEVDHFRSAPE